ncbi:MAG: site-2 protease family protein [Deltaproteobacteria bacterium]
MRWSWKIARVAGINVFVHATFLLLIVFIVAIYWVQGHSLAASAWGVLFVLAIFVCIVLHELGHALTARRYGIRTRDIVLLPIGGVARLERMPDNPLEELRVALAGPAVNVVIAAAIFTVLIAIGSTPSLHDLLNISISGGKFMTRLMAVNVWLVGFNLLPAFPMDGGRVLRALLATRMEYTEATQHAAHVGQAMALLFGFFGLFYDPFLIFVALFVWMGAEAEAAMVQMRTSLGGIPVQRVMLRDFQTLQPDDTLDLAVQHILAGWQQDFPVVFGNHVLGILTREDLLKSLAQGGSTGLVRDAMQRDFKIVDSHDMLETAVASLRESGGRSLPVLHNDVLVGILTTENVGEFVMIQRALRRAESTAQPSRPASNTGQT